jgi:hypothetical protein
MGIDIRGNQAFHHRRYLLRQNSAAASYLHSPILGSSLGQGSFQEKIGILGWRIDLFADAVEVMLLATWSHGSCCAFSPEKALEPDQPGQPEIFFSRILKRTFMPEAFRGIFAGPIRESLAWPLHQPPT